MPSTPESRTSKHGSNRNAQRTKQRTRPSGPLPSPAPSSSNKVDDAMVDPPELLLDLDQGAESAEEEPKVFIAAETPPELDVEAPDERKSRDQTVASVVASSVHANDYRVRPAALVDLDSDEPAEEPDVARQTRSPVIAIGSRPDTLARKLQTVQSFIPSPPKFPSPANLSLLSVSAPKVSSVTASGSNADRQPDGPDNDDAFHTLRITGASHERRESLVSPSRSNRHASYASQMRNDPDTVTFANFSSLGLPGNETSQLLFVGYPTGLQIWDTTNLGEVKELVNVRDIGTVLMADILPYQSESTSEHTVPDGFAAERPLIGIVSEHAGRSTFIIYSLSRHRVVKTITDIGTHVASFQASSDFIIVSTHSPHALHILSAHSLKQLHLIPSHFLASAPVQSYSQPTTPDVEIRNLNNIQPNQRSTEVPVFAVSSHLLAYASPSRSSVLTDGYHPPEPIIGSPSVISLGPVTLTQADISSAAMKVGGGILSGVKALGNFAITAARGDSNMSASTTRARSTTSSSPFFSRSAPTSSGPDEHHGGHGRSFDDAPGMANSTAGANSAPLSSSIIKVVDLRPLLDAEHDLFNPNSNSNSKSNTDTDIDLEVVSQFVAFDKEFVTGLRFSGDGVSLAVIPKSGHCVRTFKLRPKAALLRHATTDSSAMSPPAKEKQHGFGARAKSQGPPASASAKRNSFAGGGGRLLNKVPSPRDKHKPGLESNDNTNPPWNVYNLRRGLTEGVIEHVYWANDERWILFGTRKRTVHVFATNPYGGSSDEKSHMEGKVGNTHSLQPFPVDINPITRLRAKNLPIHAEGRHVPPITFALISPQALPNSLFPNLDNTASSPHSLSSSPQKVAQHLSPRYPRLARNFQDVLIFDPLDGQLTLQRLILRVRPLEHRSSTLASVPIPGGTSISLPGMSVLNRLSPPGNFNDHPGDKLLATELVAKKSVVANWSLIRQNDWPEVKAPSFQLQKFQQKKEEVQNRVDWLAQAELTTCSRSSEVLPTTIYLSHQFTFRAFDFDDDYHALIRCYNFDIPTSKIKVRKEVEAGFGSGASGNGQGDPFIEARSDPRDIRHGRTRSTFDEPLALAISADLDYSGTSPPVIPMLPNGIPGRSFKSAIPIKAVAAGLSDGMTEGLGLLKREIGKVRSPKARPVPDNKVSAVPALEFDEEDEDFQLDGDDQGHGTRDDSISRATSGDSGGSVSTPSTNPIQLASHDQWDGWGLEEDRVIEEIETFDEISAAGFMDEELARLKNVKRG